jgi:hypothetical protein
LVLKAMLTRQQVILAEQRPELAVVIGEATLHQVVDGTAVIRAQLTRLAEMSDAYPQITIQVLPFPLARPPPAATGRYRSCGSPRRKAWAWSTCPAPVVAFAWIARQTFGLVTLADKGYQESSNAKLRAPGEHANARLKTWRILRKFRCCP